MYSVLYYFQRLSYSTKLLPQTHSHRVSERAKLFFYPPATSSDPLLLVRGNSSWIWDLGLDYWNSSCIQKRKEKKN